MRPRVQQYINIYEAIHLYNIIYETTLHKHILFIIRNVLQVYVGYTYITEKEKSTVAQTVDREGERITLFLKIKSLKQLIKLKTV